MAPRRPEEGGSLSAKTTDRSNAMSATTMASPTNAEGLRDALASLASSCVMDLSRRRARASRVVVRFVRKQTEFNQLARFVLAIPLAVATPTYLGFDGRPPAPEPMAATAPRAAPPPQPGIPSEPGSVYRVTPAEPRVLSPEDTVAGPRIRAICSRSGQTVFLDDRAEANASADWREEVALKHPGAVCAFTTRFGVADPQFRPIETNTVAAPAQAAPTPDQQTPVFVRTIPVPSEALTPPDLRAGGFSLSYDKADSAAKDQIEQALAALSAPTKGAGARIAPSAARAASVTTPLPEPRPLPRHEASVAPPAPIRSEASHSSVSMAKVEAGAPAVNAEAISWDQEATSLRYLEATSRTWRGSRSPLRMGAFGEERYGSLGYGLAGNSFLETSDLDVLSHFVDPSKFPWVSSGWLFSYPKAITPAWPAASADPHAEAGSKGARTMVDFDATFAVFSRSGSFRLVPGVVPYLIERTATGALMGWPSSFGAAGSRGQAGTMFTPSGMMQVTETAWLPGLAVAPAATSSQAASPADKVFAGLPN